MDQPLPTLRAFGRWVRRQRCLRHLTPAQLGGPEFGAASVHALERGVWRPSPLAWACLAARLGDPPSAGAVAALPAPAAPDLGALDADLAYQLDHVKAHLEAQEYAVAATLVVAAAASVAPLLPQVSTRTRYRLHRLRGLTALQRGAPQAALADLALALALAEQLGDPQEEIRTRNLLGAVYYTLDQPAQALAHHEVCLHACQTGAVKDRTLRLTIVANLANDYWALGDAPQAIAWYQEARQLLRDLADPLRTAGVAWGLSLAYHAVGDPEGAIRYARQALAAYQAAGRPDMEALLQVNLAEQLRERGGFAEAAVLLEAARQYQTTAGHAVLLSRVYEQIALLALARGDRAAATAAATVLVQRTPPAGAPAPTETHAHRTYTRAWRTIGLVAEQEGDPARADAAFTQALAWLTGSDDREASVEVAEDYAAIWAQRGVPEQANRYYRRALATRPRPRRLRQLAGI